MTGEVGVEEEECADGERGASMEDEGERDALLVDDGGDGEKSTLLRNEGESDALLVDSGGGDGERGALLENEEEKNALLADDDGKREVVVCVLCIGVGLGREAACWSWVGGECLRLARLNGGDVG